MTPFTIIRSQKNIKKIAHTGYIYSQRIKKPQIRGFRGEEIENLQEK